MQMKKAIHAVIAIATSIVLFPVVSQWFISFFDEMGWYRHPAERATAGIDVFINDPWFHWIGGIVIGVALTNAAEAIVRQCESRRNSCLPVGSTRYLNSTIDVIHSKSTDQIDVQMRVMVLNLSEELLAINVTMTGSANDKKAEREVIKFESFIHPKCESIFVFEKILNAPMVGANDSTRMLVGMLNYNVDYKKYGELGRSRNSAKSIRFETVFVPMSNVGDQKQMNTTVIFDKEFES